MTFGTLGLDARAAFFEQYSRYVERIITQRLGFDRELQEIRQMCDIAAAALACDVTRVVSVQLS